MAQKLKPDWEFGVTSSARFTDIVIGFYYIVDINLKKEDWQAMSTNVILNIFNLQGF